MTRRQTGEWPWRVLVRGRFREPWIAASSELREQIFEAWVRHHERWQQAGCSLIVTLDDLHGVAEPMMGDWNFYSAWSIPGPSIVYELLNPFWDEDGEDGVRLSRYFALSVVVGKPILTMERRLGGTRQATMAIE